MRAGAESWQRRTRTAWSRQCHHLAGSLQRSNRRDGDDSFGSVGLRRIAIGETPSKVLDVVLVFACVVRMTAETEGVGILILERLDADCESVFHA